MKKVAITGGSGSGKSVVGAYLRQKGYFVADADEIAREITLPGSPVLTMLEEEFGGVITAGGVLNRKALASIVFTDISQLERLNAIMHPRILTLLQSRLNSASSESYGLPAVFAEIPLLFELNWQRHFDSSWLLVSDRQLREKRVILRDGLTGLEANRRFDSQGSADEHIKLADEVILNNSTIDNLYKKIDILVAGL